MLENPSSSIPALLFVCVELLSTVMSQATSRPSGAEASGEAVGSGDGGDTVGGLKSVSPAFGATVIIIIIVIVSGSAYLCFLKYICAGCCKPMQVAPTMNNDPNKLEEQV